MELFTSSSFWFIFGASLILLELITPGVYVVWLGVAAVAVGIFNVALPPISGVSYLLVWVALSVALCLIHYHFFKGKQINKNEEEKNSLLESLKGEQGIIVDNEAGVLRARFRDTTWKVVLTKPQNITIGDYVKAERIDGITLYVSKIEKSSTEDSSRNDHDSVDSSDSD